MKVKTDTNYSLHRIDSACPGQWLYLLGDEGVIYSEMQNCFVGLDAAGVSAYQAFDAGASIQDLRDYSDAGNLSSSSGTLEDGLESIYALAHGSFSIEHQRAEWPILDHHESANIEIHGIPVLLEYPAGPFEHLCRDYFRSFPVTTQPARSHLCAQHENDGWAIYANSRKFLSQLRNEQIGLGLLHAVRFLLYAEAEYDVAFHAAMVADNDRGIMLCAPSESGKSTLAAYLMTHGFDLLTDEPALLHLDTCSISPLCLPVSLKEGSWDVLRDEWPELASAPIHVRSDDVKIHLLHPPQGHFSAPPRRLTHIVFPEYSPSSAARAERLSPLHTLNFLNEGGMMLAKHIAQDKFEALLRLVCVTPAYALRYGSLDDATEIVHTLASEKVVGSPLREAEDLDVRPDRS